MIDHTKSVTTGGESEYTSTPNDFMKLLGGDTTPKHIDGGQTTVTTPKGGDIESMRNILEKFHSVAGESVELMEHSEIKQLAKRDPSTNREWKVVINEAEEETLYNIINTKANKSYFQNVKTLEAANLIIEHLELKNPINSTQLYKILDLDETFRRNRIDAIQFKNKWKKLVEKKRYANADVFEARYQKSKQLALDAKKQLKRL